MLEGIQQAVIGQQAVIFGKGDEQHPVENGLAQPDRLQRVAIGQGGADSADQFAAQGAIILIEPRGDVAVFLPAFLQNCQGLAGQQIVRRQQEHEALIFGWIMELCQIKAFMELPSVRIAVEADFKIIGHQHPFGADIIAGVFPCLLHRSFGTARHNGIEVLGLCALQFERGDDSAFALGEMPQSKVNRSRANLRFNVNGPLAAIIEILIT
ncbi:hypothetical protein WG908_11740 [Sphingobium sp. AN641]|uniref:hypothetical protein n=1 Tax=Sphingobium sp. AN641 TaxID=3133443 RepID=UPI0030BDD841